MESTVGTIWCIILCVSVLDREREGGGAVGYHSGVVVIYIHTCMYVLDWCEVVVSDFSVCTQGYYTAKDL